MNFELFCSFNSVSCSVNAAWVCVIKKGSLTDRGRRWTDGGERRDAPRSAVGVRRLTEKDVTPPTTLSGLNEGFNIPLLRQPFLKRSKYLPVGRVLSTFFSPVKLGCGAIGCLTGNGIMQCSPFSRFSISCGTFYVPTRYKYASKGSSRVPWNAL